jgi:chromosome condensin MukBEF MukE localization factor
MAANGLFFIISIISFLIQRKGLHNKNPHVFVRSVMAGMMVKMAICIVAIIAYVYFSGEAFNKRGVFIALFLYLIYLATEVFVVMKMNKNKKTDG